MKVCYTAGPVKKLENCFSVSTNAVEIRIWFLIRQRIIKTTKKGTDILVDESEVYGYLQKRPELWDKWKIDYEYCQTHKIA